MLWRIYKKGAMSFDAIIFMCHSGSYLKIKIRYFLLLFLRKIIGTSEIPHTLFHTCHRIPRVWGEVKDGLI